MELEKRYRELTDLLVISLKKKTYLHGQLHIGTI